MITESDPVYLKQNVLAEPLFNQWYAWPYLLSPATAAMYMANQHFKIMQSFVATPQAHVAALKNPSNAGGPFIDYDTSRVGEVRALMERMSREQSHMFEFAEAVKILDGLLGREAEGYSLEPVYPRIPDVLRGYVELVYDLNNVPSMRFIEGLLYRSPFYEPSSQTVALSLMHRDDRRFVFSTPRLEGNNCLQVKLPFSHPALDELFKMRQQPQPLDNIKRSLNINAEGEELFAELFTRQSPPECANYSGEGVRVRYFGHACVLIESSDVSVLTDPLIGYECESAVSRFTFSDLPEQIDYAVITHNHQDHCLFETLLQLRHKIKTLVVPRSRGGTLSDPCLKSILQNAGFSNILEIDAMESIDFNGGAITSLPFLGEHADLDIQTKTAYMVRLKGRSVVCAADSKNIEPKLYEHIHKLVGDVDVIFLGMECVGGPLTWLYGPLLTRPLPRKMDQSRRFDGSDYEKAIGIVEQLNPSHVYVYAMGSEPWLTFLTSIDYTDESPQIIESNKLVDDCRRRGITSERLFGQKTIII